MGVPGDSDIGCGRINKHIGRVAGRVNADEAAVRSRERCGRCLRNAKAEEDGPVGIGGNGCVDEDGVVESSGAVRVIDEIRVEALPNRDARSIRIDVIDAINRASSTCVVKALARGRVGNRRLVNGNPRAAVGWNWGHDVIIGQGVFAAARRTFECTDLETVGRNFYGHQNSIRWGNQRSPIMSKSAIVSINRRGPTDCIEMLGRDREHCRVLGVTREGKRLAIAGFTGGGQEDQE